MEIQRVLTGKPVSFSSARPVKDVKTTGQTSTDRLELTRQWVRQMDEQRERLQAALLGGESRKEKDIGGILGYMETEKDKLDALSEQLKSQQKCLIIAMRIMQGKKVPPQDEQYLMEHDPEGYKLAMALRRPPKKDEKECESVLDDEDKKSGESSDSGETAPVESSAEGGEPAASGGGESAE